MNMVILGPQGSGKGTQARRLAERFGFYYFESGALARDLAEKDPKVKEMVDRGELIASGKMANRVFEFLDRENTSGDQMIFDGFPREMGQLTLLEKYLLQKGKKIDLVIVLSISEKESIKRLSARRICLTCGEIYNLITKHPKGAVCDKCGGKLVQRKDDTPKAISQRLKEYHLETDKVVAYLKRKGKVVFKNPRVVVKNRLKKIKNDNSNSFS